MSELNKVYRDSVDIGVAFSSGAKRLLDKMPQPTLEKPAQTPVEEPQTCKVHSNQINVEEPPALENANVPKQPSLGLAGRVKQLLRPFAKLVFRLLKPVLRPVAFRIRSYLTAGMFQEVQAARDSIKQDVLNTHTLALQEFQHVHAAIIQEMQAARESLRQNFQHAHAMSLQEIQAVSTGIQDVQALALNLFPRLDRIEMMEQRVAINCGQGEILIRTEVGFVLCSTTDYALLACLIDTGDLELGTRLLIQRFLHPGEVFVDVGANIGLHSLAAAKALKGCGKIIAFEPFEPTQRLLGKSIWINGFSNITEIHQAAVSNITGYQRLFLGETSGHHSLFSLSTSDELSLKTVEVPLVRLDEIILAGQQVDLIKIDVEGAELEVLDSSTSVIMGNPDIALIVEFGPSHLKRAGHTTQQWLDNFTRLGLGYRVINSYTGVLEDWSLEELEKTDSVNLFFARKNSPAWAKATA